MNNAPKKEMSICGEFSGIKWVKQVFCQGYLDNCYLATACRILAQGHIYIHNVSDFVAEEGAFWQKRKAIMQYARYVIIALMLLLLGGQKASAQYSSIDKIGINSGLSDNYILDIAQDEEGFVWIGTECGLNRFDGNNFQVFKTNSFTNNTVSSNGINKILPDSNRHLLWIATKGGGLNVYNRKTLEFYHYPTQANVANSTRSNTITDLCYDDDGNIWIATYKDGLKKLDTKNDSVIHSFLRFVPLPRHFKINCIFDDHKGHIYIGHLNEGFTVLSTKNKIGKHYEFDSNNKNGLPGNKVYDITMDSDGRIWLATNGGLVLFDPDKNLFKVIKSDDNNKANLSSYEIRSIKEIDRQLWIGTLNGGIDILDLESFDLNNPQSVKIKHVESDNSSSKISFSSIKTIFQDSFNNTWIGTSEEGINIISHVEPFFKSLTYSPIIADEYSLSDKVVTSLYYSSYNWLWVGLRNGYVNVFKENKKTHVFEKINTLFFNDHVLSIEEDSKGKIWLGRNKEGAVQYNQATNSLQYANAFSNKKWGESLTCIYEDRDKNIWFTSDESIIKYNQTQNTFEQFSGESIGLADNYTRNITQDANGNFWIGSKINGFSVVNTDLVKLNHANLNNSLKSNTINQIYRDSDNQMWVCTINGVAVFPSIVNNEYNHFYITDSIGLRDNYTRSVIEGNKDEMWIATNAGLSRYDKKTGEVDNFDNNDGIPYGTFVNSAVTKSDDGTIFLGSNNGVCYFNSNDKVEKQALPPIIITNLYVFDTKEELHNKLINVPVSNNINLSYNQNVISFHYSIMDYALRNQVEYSYKLKGVEDDNWYSTNSTNRVIFRNLSPGKYTLYLKVRIRNQEWSNQTASIKFRIHPPMWLSWWSKLFYFIVLGLVAIALFASYRRKLTLENQLEFEKQNYLRGQEINKEKLQFFTNITHELRTPLTLILGPLEDLINKKKKDDEDRKTLSLVYKNAYRLYGLTNQIMEFRKSEGNYRQLSVVKGDITIMLKDIVQKYEELWNKKGVVVKLFIESSKQLFFDKEVITIIVDNLISNALKNTPKGLINVTVREAEMKNENFLEIEISDTGIGIPDDAIDKIFNSYYQVKRNNQVPGTGIGLALVKNLVLLHKGSINVKSQLDHGTTFVFRLRIDESYPEALHLKPHSEKGDLPNQLLIVEDNEEIIEYISGIFSDSFEILSAQNGKDALEKAIENVPHVIISDVMMPVMDGIKFCKKVKADIRTSHIPVILLTAEGSDIKNTEGYCIGADFYLTKPFSSVLLKATVNKLLEESKKNTY